MSKLKACPFCGGTDIRIHEHPGAGSGILHSGETVYSMCCYECGATFPNRYRRELLVDAWNRRTAPDREAVIEECAKVCDEMANGWNNLAQGARDGRYDFMAEAGDRCADEIRALKAAPTASQLAALDRLAENAHELGLGYEPMVPAAHSNEEKS